MEEIKGKDNLRKCNAYLLACNLLKITVESDN